MVERYNTNFGSQSRTQTAEYDEGLRAYMLKVYNFMASGVALTGIVAWVIANTPSVYNLFYYQQLTSQGMRSGMTILGWAAILSPLAFILAMNFGMQRMKASTMQMLFWAFAACFGVSVASIFMIYTGQSIVQTFFVTAGAFGALSLYGYTTKRDLSPMGTFLVMGLFGLIIASVVNIFMQSGMMQFIISVAGVVIFAGLTARDTQMIKSSYHYMGSGEMAEKGAIYGALQLYLDFINLFMFLLRFLGDRR